MNPFEILLVLWVTFLIYFNARQIGIAKRALRHICAIWQHYAGVYAARDAGTSIVLMTSIVIAAHEDRMVAAYTLCTIDVIWVLGLCWLWLLMKKPTPTK